MNLDGQFLEVTGGYLGACPWGPIFQEQSFNLKTLMK